MNLHPKIQEAFDLVKGRKKDEMLNESTLKFLRQNGVSATTVVVMLHKCFGYSLEEVENEVFDTSIFPYQSEQDIAYETMLYMG